MLVTGSNVWCRAGVKGSDVLFVRSLLVVEEGVKFCECFQHWLASGIASSPKYSAPIIPLWNYILSLRFCTLPVIPCFCLIRTWWDGVKEKVKCFCLQWEDEQILEMEIRGENPDSRGRLAVEPMCGVPVYRLGHTRWRCLVATKRRLLRLIVTYCCRNNSTANKSLSTCSVERKASTTLVMHSLCVYSLLMLSCNVALWCFHCHSAMAAVWLMDPSRSQPTGLTKPRPLLNWTELDGRCILQPVDRQAHHWEPDGFRRRPGRPRQNWRGVINKDFKKLGIGWDEVQEATEDRSSW